MSSVKMHVKMGDSVVVLSGRDKGKKGKVLLVNPKKRTVLVEGICFVTKHKKPRRQGEAGAIIKREIALSASKVMNVCKHCEASTRIGRRILENGEHARFCKKCGEIF